jgi:hypothetical protein
VKHSPVPKEEDEPAMAQQDGPTVAKLPQGDRKSLPEPNVQMCVLSEAIAVVAPSISAS